MSPSLFPNLRDFASKFNLTCRKRKSKTINIFSYNNNNLLKRLSYSGSLFISRYVIVAFGFVGANATANESRENISFGSFWLLYDFIYETFYYYFPLAIIDIGLLWNEIIVFPLWLFERKGYTHSDQVLQRGTISRMYRSFRRGVRRVRRASSTRSFSGITSFLSDLSLILRYRITIIEGYSLI